MRNIAAAGHDMQMGNGRNRGVRGMLKGVTHSVESAVSMPPVTVFSGTAYISAEQVRTLTGTTVKRLFPDGADVPGQLPSAGRDAYSVAWLARQLESRPSHAGAAAHLSDRVDTDYVSPSDARRYLHDVLGPDFSDEALADFDLPRVAVMSESDVDGITLRTGIPFSRLPGQSDAYQAEALLFDPPEAEAMEASAEFAGGLFRGIDDTPAKAPARRSASGDSETADGRSSHPFTRSLTMLTLGAGAAGLVLAGKAALGGVDDAPAAPAVAKTERETATEHNEPVDSAQTVATTDRRTKPMAERIVDIANGELDTRVETRGIDITGPVTKYFSTSRAANVQPNTEWGWQGYFAAWVRAEAGAPISPGTNWTYITDLIAHAKAQGTLAGPHHHPAPGDVVFLKRGSNYDAAVVVDVSNASMQVVRGNVGPADKAKVDRDRIGLNDPAIHRYATVPEH